MILQLPVAVQQNVIYRRYDNNPGNIGIHQLLHIPVFLLTVVVGITDNKINHGGTTNILHRPDQLRVGIFSDIGQDQSPIIDGLVWLQGAGLAFYHIGSAADF